MRFAIDFAHDAGSRTVFVTLSTDEVKRAAGRELIEHAFAMRRAVKELPENYFAKATWQPPRRAPLN